jgi:alpha-aminoadipic semialdehyde synthase
VRDRVFEVVFREEDLVEPRDQNARFALQQYYDHPEAYRSTFARQLPHITVLVNAIYWSAAYPRLVDKATLRDLFARGTPRLVCIGDIGCDIDGAVECTVEATTPGRPAYVWDPANDLIRGGYDGPGVAMMTTDCLPCELSKEASEAFTDALGPFVPAIARADYEAPDPSSLPAEIQRAVILWRGELTEPYRHLQDHLSIAGAAARPGQHPA